MQIIYERTCSFELLILFDLFPPTSVPLNELSVSYLHVFESFLMHLMMIKVWNFFIVLRLMEMQISTNEN